MNPVISNLGILTNGYHEPDNLRSYTLPTAWIAITVIVPAKWEGLRARDNYIMRRKCTVYTTGIMSENEKFWEHHKLYQRSNWFYRFR